MRGTDRVSFFAHAAGHYHTAIFSDGLANRGEAFFLGRIEEPAGVDQHHVGTGIIRAHRIAIGAQSGEDAFGIDERFGTAKADHTDAFLFGQNGGLCGGSSDHNRRAPTPSRQNILALAAQRPVFRIFAGLTGIGFNGH